MLKEPKITERQLNKIQNKVLVIAGEKDVITQTHTEFMAKEMPNSELKIYKDASHMIPFENANQLSEDILDFMRE